MEHTQSRVRRTSVLTLAASFCLLLAASGAINLSVEASDTGGGPEVATRGTVCKRLPKRLRCQ